MSDNKEQESLDVILHQPLRTRIVAYLSARNEATFTELKQLMDVTDGNLEAHIKKLCAADYLAKNKQTGQGRPQTFYQLTDLGKNAFKHYVKQLQHLLDI